MACLRRTVLSLAIGILCAHARAETVPDSTPTADAIMARVAANQDRSEAGRNHYVYVQHAHVVSRKGKTVMCEETTDFRVAPSAHGSRAELLKLDGRMLVKNKYIAYDTLPSSKSPDAKDPAGNHDKSQAAADHDTHTIEITDDSTDRDLVEDLRADLIRNSSGERQDNKPQTDAPESGKAGNGSAKDRPDKDTTNKDESDKDGLNSDSLFPLGSNHLHDYAFRLLGRERMNGRDVFHLTFHPKDKADYGWTGDAYVDTQTYQPVVVSTDMARKIPFAVRTLLGTNVPGLGFTIVYAPQPDGIWFPVSFSTEFKLHVLFFFKREILIDAKNRDFEKTHVTSKIVDSAQTTEP